MSLRLLEQNHRFFPDKIFMYSYQSRQTAENLSWSRIETQNRRISAFHLAGVIAENQTLDAVSEIIEMVITPFSLRVGYPNSYRRQQSLFPSIPTGCGGYYRVNTVWMRFALLHLCEF
jgi:hypothetical protein